MQINKINNIRVRPITPLNPPVPTIGAALFPEIFSTVYIMARRKSGKTQLINTILKKCASRSLADFTHVLLFVSTARVDGTYAAIIKELRARGYSVTVYTSIKTAAGGDRLADLLKMLRAKKKRQQTGDGDGIESDDEENADDEGEEQPPDEDVEEEDEQKCNYLFVFDDISSELNNPNLTTLLKQGRHFRAKIVISSQSLFDLTPPQRMQINYLVLFANVNSKKLRQIYDELNTAISYQQFIGAYNEAVKQPYEFLLVDKIADSYKITFNRKINFTPNPNHGVV